MNALARFSRILRTRQMALVLLLGLALLPSVQAFALTCFTRITRYYAFGYEVWRSEERVCINES